jgi:hypothetical protein
MDEYFLFNIKTGKVEPVNKSEVLDKIYIIEMRLPTDEELKINKIHTKSKEIKKLISKIEDKVPLYDAYSENLYLINKLNVYDRVTHFSYRFPEIELLEELYKVKDNIENINNLNDPLIKRKIRKINLIQTFIEQFDLTTLFDTYVNVFYKYSDFAGKGMTLCKRPSFIPQSKHITPYYTKNEVIAIALNMGINVDVTSFVEQPIIKKLCKKIKQNEMSASMMLSHQKYIIESTKLGLVQYYTLQGSSFMNQYLRGFTNYKCQNKYIENQIRPMWDLVINSPPFDKSYVLYRFVGSDEHIKHLKIGDVYVESGFMSTTRDPFYRSDLYEFGFILMKIKIPANVDGIALCLELTSHFPEEQEIIFPPNTSFKLIKKDEDVPYFHTNKTITSQVKVRYEFEWTAHDSPSFITKTDNTNELVKSEPINFLTIKGVDRITLSEKINWFVKKHVNEMHQFTSVIGDNTYITVVEEYDSTGAYKNFYALETSNGYSIYSIYDGFILFFIELGDTNNGKEMHVNYYLKYNMLDTEKILGDNNFIQYISSIAYYFGIPNVVLYANYMSTSMTTTIQSGGVHQRSFSGNIIKNPILLNYTDYLSCSYCVDIWKYLKNGEKRYEQTNCLNIELRPKFSYRDLDMLKTLDIMMVLSKSDNDECYQIYDKLFRQTSLPQTVSEFYLWLKDNKCYLIDTFTKKISKVLQTENPFINDMYILEPASYLYNRKMINTYPIYESILSDPKKKLQGLNKNYYRTNRNKYIN